MVVQLKVVVAFVLFFLMSGSYLSPLNTARRVSNDMEQSRYRASEGYNRAGYQDDHLDGNRYEIEYLVNGLTSRERLRLYVQKRAAQIGQSIGASHFSLQLEDQDYTCYRESNLLWVFSELDSIATYGTVENLTGSVLEVDQTIVEVDEALAAMNETKHDLQMIYVANYVTCDTGDVHEPDEMIEYLQNARKPEGTSFTGRRSRSGR